MAFQHVCVKMEGASIQIVKARALRNIVMAKVGALRRMVKLIAFAGKGERHFSALVQQILYRVRFEL